MNKNEEILNKLSSLGYAYEKAREHALRLKKTILKNESRI